MGNGNSPHLRRYFLRRPRWISSNGYMGEALDITRHAIVKLGTQEADLSVKEVDEIISSICEVASRFNKITQKILPEQIRSKTLQMIQSRIEHNSFTELNINHLHDD